LKIRVGGRLVEARRTTLLPYEVAYVLQVPERAVKNMIRRGELRDASTDRWRRADPLEVAARIADRPLALEALAALIEGRHRAPRAADDRAVPPSIIEHYRPLP
jgi:hypothetical protein